MACLLMHFYYNGHCSVLYVEDPYALWPRLFPLLSLVDVHTIFYFIIIVIIVIVIN